MYLFSGISSKMLVFQGGAVKPVHELHDLHQFVLYHLQADNSIELSIILPLQGRHVFHQPGETTFQTQQQTLQLQSLQTEETALRTPSASVHTHIVVVYSITIIIYFYSSTAAVGGWVLACCSK